MQTAFVRLRLPAARDANSNRQSFRPMPAQLPTPKPSANFLTITQSAPGRKNADGLGTFIANTLTLVQ